MSRQIAYCIIHPYYNIRLVMEPCTEKKEKEGPGLQAIVVFSPSVYPLILKELKILVFFLLPCTVRKYLGRPAILSTCYRQISGMTLILFERKRKEKKKTNQKKSSSRKPKPRTRACCARSYMFWW